MNRYNTIVFLIILIISSCSLWTQKSKSSNHSYFITTDTTANKVISKIIFNNPQKRTFVLITENNPKSGFLLSDNNWQKQSDYEFTLTCINEPLIQYTLMVSEKERQSVLKYEHFGFTTRRCETIIENDTINLFNNEYTENCFQVQRLEPPLDESFLIEFSEKNNKANKLTIKRNNDFEKNNIDIFFPNSILWFVPELDFAMVYLSENNKDTLTAYFSLHDLDQWYLDSISDKQFEKTKIINQKLKFEVPNYLN